jgi:4-hydroxy-tetrahydrodipicolinate synthase
MSIAHAVRIPVILYNVPSRTGLDIPVSVYQRLARIPNIVGVKEASTDVSKIAKIRSVCGNDFAVWSGNDDLAVPAIAIGASGLISVISNIAPVETNAMVQAALDGDFDSAADLQCRLAPLIETLFCEVNPIPVKAAMRCIGYDCGQCRLPLTGLTSANQEKINKLLS